MDVASTLLGQVPSADHTKPNSVKKYNPQTALINTNPPVKVTLSKEALEFLSSKDESKGADSDFGGLNLSKKDKDRLAAIDKKIESLFVKNEKDKLTKEEETQLNKLLKESDQILFKNELDNTPGLSKADKDKALKLFKQIGDLLDKYGFDKEPSKEDSAKLEKLTTQLDTIFDKSQKASFEQELANIPGLSDKDKKAAVKIFKQIESILEKYETNGSPTKAEEKKLDSLTAQLDKLLGVKPDNDGQSVKTTDSDKSKSSA